MMAETRGGEDHVKPLSNYCCCEPIILAFNFSNASTSGSQMCVKLRILVIILCHLLPAGPHFSLLKVHRETVE